MKQLIAVYNYVTPHRPDGDADRSRAAYRISCFLGCREALSKRILRETYKKLFPQDEPGPGKGIGPFGNVAEINKYAFHLCQRLNIEGIGLISTEKYNALLEQSDNIDEVASRLEQGCDYMRNIEHKKRTGLLGRLFH